MYPLQSLTYQEDGILPRSCLVLWQTEVWGALVFREGQVSPYYYFSPIGFDASNESSRLERVFTGKYPHELGSGRYELRADFLQEQRRLSASLGQSVAVALSAPSFTVIPAAVYAVALRREHLQNAPILAARAVRDATIELMTDDFVHAWGPHFSRKATQRRGRALAAAAEAFAAAHAANTPEVEEFSDSDSEDGSGGWGNGGGSAANGAWGGGWGNNASANAAAWGNGGWGNNVGWNVGWGAGGGWGNGGWNAPVKPKRRRRSPLAWAKVRLVGKPLTVLQVSERTHRVIDAAARRMLHNILRERARVALVRRNELRELRRQARFSLLLFP
ncbi:hypothetical protein C8R47DRAFT_1083774 [Mycena vitilis]|nr:hypothetical protein C8R47DRAFT_1083774 [Mycena vitilis]